MNDSPKEKVMDLLAFAEAAKSFAEAVKNPKAVDALTSALIDSVAMSEAKKKEFEDAKVAITESNRIITKAEKALNDVEVARGFANQEATSKKQGIDAALGALEGQRIGFKSQVDEKMKELDSLKSSLVSSQRFTDERSKELDSRASALNVRESNINAKEARLIEREASISSRESTLKEEEDKLAARNQKVIDAAMGK